MPYIKKEDRRKFDIVLMPFLMRKELDYLPAGDLNYLITKILDRQVGITPNYARYNELIGMLECCKLELYRRMIAPYEDKKKDFNGDVYSVE